MSAVSRELFDAIDRHDVTALAALLAAGADANAVLQRRPDWGPLKLAVSELYEGGPAEAVALLLRHGAQVDGGPDPDGHTPLVIAADLNRPDAVRLLLLAGADVNVRCPDIGTPLRLAVGHRDLAIVELLLKAGADRTIDDWGSPNGNTALGWAVWNTDAAMIEVLLAAGADPDATDDYHQTAWDILWGRCRDESDPRAWAAAAAALGRAPE